MVDKLTLENQIFARALRLGASVYAKNGGLNIACADPKLHALVAVYNAFFRVENWRAFCAPEEPLAGWKMYRAQRFFAAGLTPVLQPGEWKFEMIVSEER